MNEDLSMTILYLPQLLGLAMGISEEDLHLKDNFAITKEFREKL